MKPFVILLGLLISIAASAECMDGEKRFQSGEKNCNGLVCGKDGFFHGKGTKMICRYEEEKPCFAYGRGFEAGEEDCDGRICREDGTWQGVVKSGMCDLDDSARDPASVKKHPKKKKAHK